MESDYRWILQYFTDDKRPRVQDQLKSRGPETWRLLQNEWNELAGAIQAAYPI